MTPAEAEKLAARTLTAIDLTRHDGDPALIDNLTADRERVASDRAGLAAHEDCGAWHHGDGPCADERRYEDGLRRTAALYGVTG